MDFKPLLALIDAKLKAKKRSAHDVSNEAGHPDAIRNMRRKLNGELKGGITVETVVDVAKVLEIAPETLARVLMGHPAPVDDEVRSLRDLRDLIDGQISERTAPPARRRSRQ